ncbi:MAG TPA: polysaccharide deacetylase family protein [bacterium]|nr:polysaccharide deacetylase family protein [bacterium]
MRQPGAISVDMDGFAAMYRTRGWSIPSSVRDLNCVWSDAMPRFLDLFAEEGVRATFFVVGEDALPNRALLRRAVSEGHEIANHSMRHLHLPTLPPDQAEREVVEAEDAIGHAIGSAPRGFRSPAWMPTERLLDLLQARGYRYDASVFPTPWLSAWRSLPSLRRFPPRFTRGLDWPWAFAPRAPHLVRGALWEIPAATLPLVRVPVWGTILHWLGPEAFRALTRASALDVPLSMVLHGWELVDFALLGDERFLQKPGFERPVDARLSVLRASLRWTKERWRLSTMGALVDEWSGAPRG